MRLESDHPIQCRCGQFVGMLSAGARFTRAICYCRDCQAYASALGEQEGILDAFGGTGIVASLQQWVRVTGGVERLACLSLSDRGLLRWYADCCNTPIANTPRDPKLSYVGIVHNCLSRGARPVDDVFGPSAIAINVGSAKAAVPSSGIRTLTASVRIIGRVMRARMNGSWRQSPFFGSDSRPVVKPRVLAALARS